MSRWLALLAAASVVGCTTMVRGRLEPPPPVHGSRHTLAGAARVDLTPPPGFPMGGHSLSGHIGEGYWTRLRARAIYVEDANGHGLALVATDLWQISEGLTDEVARLVAQRAVPISRDQILLSASHTHHSPAAYSTDAFFSAFAGKQMGFDRALFDFLASRIAEAIARAYTDRVEARVSYGETTADRIFRNRSLDPFLQNDEARTILDANAHLTGCGHAAYQPDACRAVDPSIAVVRMERASDHRPIAVAVLLAAHATVIDHRSTLYGSDLFGYAATRLERRLGSAEGGTPVVALFNGAEGDASFAWDAQDRSNLVALANRVMDGTAAALRLARPLSPIAITQATTRIPLGGQSTAGDAPPTATWPMPGQATICGAEDGPSGLPAWLAHEGARGTPYGPHGVKVGALDPTLRSRRLLPFSLTQLAVGALFPPPREVPLGIYRLGPLALVALPGEFTTVLAQRIRAAVAQALPGSPPATVRTVGLANGYAYYFTTPEEYALQHYEGSGTMYGTAIGPVLIERYDALARIVPIVPTPFVARDFRHACGVTKSFGLENVHPGPAPVTSDGLRYVLAQAVGDVDADPLREYCWRDGVPELPSHTTPHVRIDRRQADGSWEPLAVDDEPQDDEGERFVVRAGRRLGGSEWCATWIVPAGVPARAVLRFHVITLAGAAIAGPTFSIPAP